MDMNQALTEIDGVLESHYLNVREFSQSEADDFQDCINKLHEILAPPLANRPARCLISFQHRAGFFIRLVPASCNEPVPTRPRFPTRPANPTRPDPD